MLRNRQNRRNAVRQSPDDDHDDVDGSEDTASETNVDNFPLEEGRPGSDSDCGEPEPDPEPERSRVRRLRIQQVRNTNKLAHLYSKDYIFSSSRRTRLTV